ncbi:MAG: calcium/sodium antiporter [Ruminococcaceae bacterium]|nr:calcium/sodium antiporter [Oscillospiraceae bacterium]
MEFVFQFLILVIGFVMLVRGADYFVDGAASIAAKFKIPQLIIGLTVVAMGTSAPEAAVSISAAFKGSADITVGNILGSNILNVLVILGLSAVICTLTVSKSVIYVNLPIMIGSSALLLALGYDGTISHIDAIIISACFLGFLAYMIISAIRSNQSGEDIKEMTVARSVILTIVGLVLIVLGSRLTVDSASFIAKKIGLSERFIGLTVVALGTSLPELFTSVTAARKGNADIAIGNIVGSNIFNILFIVGISGIIIPVPYDKEFMFDSLVSLGTSVLLLLLTFRKGELKKWGGILLLMLYVAYFACILR